MVLPNANKTVIQCLGFHVDRNQKGWVKALPKIRFDIMNTLNASTGFSPFILKTGRSPRLLPPCGSSNASNNDLDEKSATSLIESINEDVRSARDNMLAAKISQAIHANAGRASDPAFRVGEKVLLATAHRRRDFMQKKDGRVAKFMPRFDGPYEIQQAFPESSVYKLNLPPASQQNPMFHASLLRRYVPNDKALFPGRELERPGPIITPNGASIYLIDRLMDERTRGRGKQYLVRWIGYGPESDLLGMPQFGSEPKFEPELFRTGPKFGPRFSGSAEPDHKSGSEFRQGRNFPNVVRT